MKSIFEWSRTDVHLTKGLCLYGSAYVYRLVSDLFSGETRIVTTQYTHTSTCRDYEKLIYPHTHTHTHIHTLSIIQSCLESSNYSRWFLLHLSFPLSLFLSYTLPQCLSCFSHSLFSLVCPSGAVCSPK